MSELTKRVLIGTLLALFTLFCLLYHPLTFYALLLLIALMMYAEWLELTQDSPLLNRFGGLIYVGVPVWSMIALRGTESPHQVLILLGMVWATDIIAYAVGKRYGRTRIAPSISPGKSWEGLGAGMMASALIGVGSSFMEVQFPQNAMQGFFIGCSIAMVAQGGDFFESWLKRRAGVKDSGALIPGHGGILDRVDGLVFAAPVYALMVMMLGTP